MSIFWKNMKNLEFSEISFVTGKFYSNLRENFFLCMIKKILENAYNKKLILESCKKVFKCSLHDWNFEQK